MEEIKEIKRRGGARPGAGRRKGSGNPIRRLTDAERVSRLKAADGWFEEEVEFDGQKIPRWKKFYMNLERLAEGIFKTDEADESKKVYWIAPDREANKYLIDRRDGKPIDRTEHSGEVNTNLELSESQFTQLIRTANERANRKESGK